MEPGNALLFDCTDPFMRNNIFLTEANGTGYGWRRTTDTGGGVTITSSSSSSATDSDYNDYWPRSINPAPPAAPIEAHSFLTSPLFASGHYFTNAHTSPIVSSGAVVAGFNADYNGWYRHLTHPCVGAIEFEFETTDIDAAGRVQRRTVAGRTYDYQQDAMGRLTAYTDYQNTANSATYSYDYRSRRVAMTVGGITTRFVYDGDDVVAEFVDEDADNQPDRMRYYWNLPGIDQRIGFVDVDVDTGAASYYYYLTDQVGSVMAVVDADGDIVNRYDYDAFGNLRRGTSWETVPNRYRFQGREYDAHRGDYYFRLRTYIPEWGMFTGPDFQLDPSDENGCCNYLFANNNPLVFVDPTGLEIAFIVGEDPTKKGALTQKVLDKIKAQGDKAVDKAVDEVAKMKDKEFETLKKKGLVLFAGVRFKGTRKGYIQQMLREKGSYLKWFNPVVEKRDLDNVKKGLSKGGRLLSHDYDQLVLLVHGLYSGRKGKEKWLGEVYLGGRKTNTFAEILKALADTPAGGAVKQCIGCGQGYVGRSIESGSQAPKVKKPHLFHKVSVKIHGLKRGIAVNGLNFRPWKIYRLVEKKKGVWTREDLTNE